MKAKMSKKSTLTITVMACLLAVAVATTIVLAAFSASKDATTTITFSNGVQLKITGASQTTENNPDDVMSTGPATLNWNVILTPYNGGTASGDPATTDKTGDVGGDNGLDGASKVELAAISMDVAGSGNATIYLAVKPKVSWNKGSGASAETGTVTVTPESGWTAGEVESDGTWYLKSVQLTNGSISNVAFSAITGIYTPAGTSADNAYAGREYTAQIAFEASTVAIHTVATP